MNQINALERIQADLAVMEVDESQTISGEIEDGEEVIGNVDDPKLQRLMHLNLAYRQAMREGINSPEHDHSQECPKCQELMFLEKLIDVTDTLFWASVRNQYKLWFVPQLGLRNDWQLVRCPVEIPEPVKALAALFGLPLE